MDFMKKSGEATDALKRKCCRVRFFGCEECDRRRSWSRSRSKSHSRSKSRSSSLSPGHFSKSRSKDKSRSRSPLDNGNRSPAKKFERLNFF
ncbi:Uncharacterised protein g7058 [Pycnogonum litorale]